MFWNRASPGEPHGVSRTEPLTAMTTAASCAPSTDPHWLLLTSAQEPLCRPVAASALPLRAPVDSAGRSQAKVHMADSMLIRQAIALPLLGIEMDSPCLWLHLKALHLSPQPRSPPH